MIAGRWGRRFGMRGALTQAQVLTGLARGLVPLAAFAPSPLALLVTGEFILGFGRSIFNVNQLSMRLALTPDHLQGRMTASIRFMMWAVVPAGALAGGYAAEHIGLVPTLTLAAIGTALSSLWFLLIPRDAR
jgi:MFS family permease